MNKKRKLFIVAPGRWGKDSVAELLKMILDYNFDSSSHFCAEKIIYPALKDKYGYTSVEECFNDRHRSDEMRATWYNLIANYSKDDPTRLSREIFEKYDIYVGCRNNEEFIASMDEGLADWAIWVDASERKELEPESSMTITRELVESYPNHYILDNNGSRIDLTENVIDMIYELEL